MVNANFCSLLHNSTRGPGAWDLFIVALDYGYYQRVVSYGKC